MKGDIDMIESIKTLPKKLKEKIYKHGYFFLSTKGKADFWVDLYSLSHLFNAEEKAKEYQCFLKKKMLEIILHQKEKLKINSVIIPRWTCSTEDLFTETLLDLCFELFHEFPDDVRGLAVYELFNAGNGNYYLNSVYTDKTEEHIKAVAFLALDIHFGIIKKLVDSSKGINIPSVISVIGRCDPVFCMNNCDFKIIPLFNACSKLEKNLDEFYFIMNKKTALHKKLFDSGYDYKQYIPFDKWDEWYSKITTEMG